VNKSDLVLEGYMLIFISHSQHYSISTAALTSSRELLKSKAIEPHFIYVYDVTT
jgi:hypothetical protein